MSEYVFDHDRLDVYVLSIEYNSDVFKICQSLNGLYRHARDQWLRAAQSIPLNIAEGNGKRSLKDRARFLDIARGSALECAAIQDVLIASNALEAQVNQDLKVKLYRIVAMLTRMAMKFESVSESGRFYVISSEQEQEHEHEHEHEHEQEQEQEQEQEHEHEQEQEQEHEHEHEHEHGQEHEHPYGRGLANLGTESLVD